MYNNFAASVSKTITFEYVLRICAQNMCSEYVLIICAQASDGSEANSFSKLTKQKPNLDYVVHF